MGIPASPPRRYTNSRQLVGGDDINNIADQLNSFQQLVAAGASQNAASAINASNVELTTAAAAGVRLPVSFPGAIINILNNSGQTQNVYPSGTDQVANTTTTYFAASSPGTIVNLLSSSYVCIKKGFWQVSKTTGT
jgi:hypothetical protein